MRVGGQPRVAIVCDLVEEHWPSMDLVADVLLAGLGNGHAGGFEVARLRPAMRRRFTRAGAAAGRRFNADRVLNRFFDYPRALRRRRDEFDLFHVVDHSYAQLVHHLPAERTVVTCHDLDAFRCLLEPGEAARRSPLFRRMTRRVLEGFLKAARVSCVSAATRDELLKHKLFPPERLTVIPNGVHPSLSREANAEADDEAARLLGAGDAETIELLHVGSNVARKRIDVLLKVFAEVRKRVPRARLVRVGGAFTAAQAALVEALNLKSAITVLPFLKPDVLAAVYRRAALVLQPSEREGFGLPVAEALACGTPVVASRIPALGEVGGDAAVYAPVGDTEAWADAVNVLLCERAYDPARWAARRAAGVRRAARFTWENYVAQTGALYHEVLSECG